jgi:hypothetical protein
MKELHSPILLAMQGWPLMTGVFTGARHWAVYGFDTNPGAQVLAAATGAETTIPTAAPTTATPPPNATAKRRWGAAIVVLSLCCRRRGYA